MGKEWWYGLRRSIDITSMRDGPTSRGPFSEVRSKARWQYIAYFPISDLFRDDKEVYLQTQ